MIDSIKCFEQRDKRSGLGYVVHPCVLSLLTKYFALNLSNCKVLPS